MLNPTCIALVAAALGLLTAPAAQASRALAEKNNCMGCHALDTRMVGPGLREVGARYSGQPDARATLAASIRQGGSGRWGDVPMPPQAQLRPADAQLLADWILKGAR